jgi:hypothetical protein
VKVSSSRGSQTFTTSTGSLVVTTINGEPVVPGIQYTVTSWDAGLDYAAPVTQSVPNAYPTDLTSTFTTNMSPPVPVTVTVKNTSGTPQSSATVTMTGGPLSVNLSGTTNGSGQYVFNVPVGSGYTINATKGLLRGSWSGSIAGSTSLNITIS